jgi:hypothetical protein
MTRARDNSFNPFNNNYAGKNLLINGNFDIWQRGISGFTSNNIYTADRWFVYSQQNYSLSQETSIIPNNSTYAAKITITNSNGYCNLQNTLEQIEVERLLGQTITFSVWLRANSTYNGSFSIQILYSTTGNSQTPTWQLVPGAATSHTPSTSQYTKVTVTGTVPTNAKNLTFYIGQNVVLANGSIYYIGQAQAEIGSVATLFSRAGGDIQGELAKCQRYFEKNYIPSIAPGSNINPASNGMIEQQALILTTASGATIGSSRSRSFPYPFKVQKRVTPSYSFWDLAGNTNKYTSGDINGSFAANNNSLDFYGGLQVTQDSITWQSTMASSSHYYAGIMWAVSAEL